MNAVGSEEVMAESLIDFHCAETRGYPNSACGIVGPSASMTERVPILVISCGDHKVACSYVLNAGHRIDPPGRQREKSRLIRNLLRFAGTSQELVFEASAAEGEIQIISDVLGKPELYVDGHQGPSVSFSHAAGVTWGFSSGVRSQQQWK